MKNKEVMAVERIRAAEKKGNGLRLVLEILREKNQARR
jgi:hypothetical protein